MAYGNPGSMGGDDGDMFDDGPKKKMDEGDGMDMEGELPNALMAGKDFAVGEEIVLEITRKGEKSFSVKYAKDKGEGKDEGEHEGMDTMTKKADTEMEEMY